MRPTILAAAVLLASATAHAHAQTTFSIDNHGPTITVPDAFTGTRITAGDILTPSPFGPGPNPPLLGAPTPPGTFISAGASGLGLAFHSICVGVPPDIYCEIEVDALSYGLDYALPDVGPAAPGTFQFSVDEYAMGIPGAPAAPNVSSEGAASVNFEAAADVFGDPGAAFLPPWAPFAIPPGNSALYDGNGLPNASSVAYPGFGVIEAILPGPPPNTGDNIDAFDNGTALPPVGGSGTYPVYFSLDSSYFDVVFGYPLSSTALVHGFVGGDVLRTTGAGGPPTVFAPATSLGLDFFGPDTDDLDALAVWENGSGVFEPSSVFYDWLGGRDMVLFSVRRGSAVIGMPDSFSGIPIEPGDILSTPLPGGGSPFPSLFIAAECLGLTTTRSFGASDGDDLDALDTVAPDCNANGTPDWIDVTSGTSTDVNTNGIPDECELIATPYCFCSPSDAPCGNPDPAAGCRNSTGAGALITGSGTSSILNDDLFLSMSPLPPSQFGLFYTGPSTLPNIPFGDGLRCVGGGVFRLPIINSGAAGVSTYGPVVGYLNTTFPGLIVSLSTWHFQGWYRDPGGPCATGFNLTNALSVTFTP